MTKWVGKERLVDVSERKEKSKTSEMNLKSTHVLAPKLKKNCRNVKQTIKDALSNEWNFPARIPTKKPFSIKSDSR